MQRDKVIIVSIAGILILGVVIIVLIATSPLNKPQSKSNNSISNVNQSLPTGYTMTEYTIEKVLSETCTKHEDCTTPPEYALQSRCPFITPCIEQKCTVVCPQFKR